MTDIYDFRDEKFTKYGDVWKKIHHIIYNFYKIKGHGRTTDQIFVFFKNHTPKIFENCSEEIIKSFILQSSQISHHELVYLPNKKKREVEDSINI